MNLQNFLCGRSPRRGGLYFAAAALALVFACVTIERVHATPGDDSEPLVYTGPDGTSNSGPDGYHDGQLRPAIGTKNFQILRANRTHPDLSDGIGMTYNHGPDLAYWHGEFYCAWLNSPWGEEVPPGMTMFATSKDGAHWSFPRVLFPMYTYAASATSSTMVAMHQRMVYYQAPDHRLLACGFYGGSHGDGIGRVVREIRANGSLGPIYFIRPNDNWGRPLNYPLYSTSKDAAFVADCQALLNDPVRRLNWIEEDRFSKDGATFYAGAWHTEKFKMVPGQAMCFFTRPDGALITLYKSRWAAVTHDLGKTWSPPARIPTLTYGGAKIWAQQTSDGKFAAVYNPTNNEARHPLAVAVSADGIHFDGLAAIHGEVPIERFWGKEKRPGPQYVRGILPGNGTPPDSALHVVYSVSKEDIWTAAVPVPIRREWTGPVHDNFDKITPGDLPADWNLYIPKWCPIMVLKDGMFSHHYLRLMDRDPYDYACATRIFAAAPKTQIAFNLRRDAGLQPLEIEVVDAKGTRLIQLKAGDALQTADAQGQWSTLANLQPGAWHKLSINADASTHQFTLDLDGQSQGEHPFAATGANPERIIFRTGAYRLHDPVQKYKSGDESIPSWDEPNPDDAVPANVFDLRAFSAVAQ